MKFVESAQFRVCCKCFSFCGTWSVGRARKPHWAGRGNTPILQTLLFCPQLYTAVTAQGQIQELALGGGFTLEVEYMYPLNQQGGLESAVSSPSGVRRGAPAKNEFCAL